MARSKAQAAQRPRQSASLGSSEVEQSLRERALTKNSADQCAAILILADFYEYHGQPSRAALWREQLLEMPKRPIERRHALLEEIPDLRTRAHRQRAFDSRRNQMMWLLRKQGVSVRKVGEAFGLSPTRIEQLVAAEDRLICLHAKGEQLWPTLKATERLIAAGALTGDRPTRAGHQELWFDLRELPPDDWPAEHKRRGK